VVQGDLPAAAEAQTMTGEMSRPAARELLQRDPPSARPTAERGTARLPCTRPGRRYGGAAPAAIGVAGQSHLGEVQTRVSGGADHGGNATCGSSPRLRLSGVDRAFVSDLTDGRT
jgi:hypothetical protein